ncbi:MAG: AAA family ATPase [Thermoplasmata archaeon]|nr:AAA family ATPase [Thermoplasmata archaeon]
MAERRGKGRGAGSRPAAGVPRSRVPRPIVLTPKEVSRQLVRPVVIAVANRKGGVGKTTTSVNMAACLALMGHPTLLVDMDSQGHSTSGLGLEPSDINGTALDLLTGERPIEDAIVPTTVSGLDLVPATIDLSKAEVNLVSHPERELRLSAALDPVRGEYDFIFIDTPPSLGMLTVNSLVAADDVLIPLQCEYFALEGVKDLVGIVKVVSDNLNPDLRIEGILLTMYEPTPLSREIQNEVRSHFGDSVFGPVVPRDRRIAEAQSMGVPAVQYRMGSPGTQAYIKAAMELSRRHLSRDE